MPPPPCRRLTASLTAATTHACRCCAALACRSWHRLATAPSLLRSVQATAFGMPDLRSLTAFLLSLAAGHAEELDIEYCSMPNDEDEDDDTVAAEAAAESAAAAAELAAALAVCGRAGQLSRVRLVTVDLPVTAGSWLLPLRASLRRLQLGMQQPSEEEHWMDVQTPLHAFTALEALHANTGDYGWLLPSCADSLVRLPRSLTALHLAQLPSFRVGLAVIDQV